MIDLHCHVLPGVDDGPPTMEGSLALARGAVARGVRTIVATPHVSWDMPHNTAASIAEGVAAVNGALQDAGVPLDVLTGGEVAMSRAGDLEPSELDALRLGGGPWLLVECPFSPAAGGIEAILRGLATRGHRILLAHPERSPAFMPAGRLAAFVETGMLAQVTATSLTGGFGREVQRVARAFVRDGLAHVISSDAHDATKRPPGMREHIERAGFATLADWLTDAMPAAIVAGDPLPPRPEPPEAPRRGLLGRLRR